MGKGIRSPLPDKNRPGLPLMIILMLAFFNGYTQSWNPAIHIPINDALGQSQQAPIDGRSMFYSLSPIKWRPYQSTNEVLSTLTTTASRFGNFIIIVDSGGVLQNDGTFLNGHNVYYMFADSTTNGGLVKLNLFGTSGCVGCLLAANNLSDLLNVPTARNNLGLGSMAVLNATGAGDLSGTWPNISVTQFNGQLPSYYLNYNNLTNKPVGLSLTTTGTSGPAGYNSTTGILNIPVYGGGGSPPCLNCNADTISNIPIVLGAIRNNYCLILDSTDGHFYLGPCGSGSGGSGTVTNIAVTVPSSLLTITGTPINTSGTFAFGLSNASANTVWGNNTGSTAAPVYYVPNSTLLNTWFGGNIQPQITLTTTGTTGAATFSGNTLNVPVYSASGSCPTCYSTATSIDSFTYTLNRTNGTADTFRQHNWLGYLINIGTGYRIYAPNVPGFKTLFAGTNVTLDTTTNANGITISSTGGSSFWTLTGSNLYPNSTSYKVGIGTISPTNPLTVVGSSVFSVTNSTAGFGGTMTGASVTMTQAAIANGSQPLMVGFSSSLAANASDTLTTGIMYFANAVNPSGKIPSVYGFSAVGGTLTNYGTYNQFQSNDATTGSGLTGFFSNISAGTNKLQANFSGTAPVVSFGNFLMGTTSASNSAQLFMNSTTQGFKPPSMNTTQQNAIAGPVTGLLVYNTDSAAFTYWNSAAWIKIGTGATSAGTDTVNVKRGLGVTSANTVVLGQQVGQHLDSSVYISFNNTLSSLNNKFTLDSVGAGFKMNGLLQGAAGKILVHMTDSSIAQLTLGTNLSIGAGGVLNAAGITLTTTGSGAATLVGNALNVPTPPALSVGTFSGSSQANGAGVSGGQITFGPADATNPGMVTTGTQTLAGTKSFSSNPIFNTISSVGQMWQATNTTGQGVWGNIVTSGGGIAGNYIPTLTNTTNISSNTLNSSSYSRNGNIIHVNIGGTISPTSALTATVLTVSLPLTTSATTQTQIGQGTYFNGGGVDGYISIASGTTATFNFTTGSGTGTQYFNIQFDYSL
jgi:hypothetical protein